MPWVFRPMMSGTQQCTGSAAGAPYQTLGMDLPLSESDEGRSVLTFDKRDFPLPGNMLFIFPTTWLPRKRLRKVRPLFIFPTTRLPPGRPCHPRTTTLLRPSFGSGPVYRPDLGWGQQPPQATAAGQKFLQNRCSHIPTTHVRPTPSTP